MTLNTGHTPLTPYFCLIVADGTRPWICVESLTRAPMAAWTHSHRVIGWTVIAWGTPVINFDLEV